MSSTTTLLSLFFIAFGSATILPLQSEAVLTALLATQEYAAWLLVLVASIGNILGSIVNWFLGRGIERFGQKKWFPVKEKSLDRAKQWYARYGRWTLLLSWVPIIGDPLTIVAGIMREKITVFIAIVAIAKTGRYILVALLAQGILSL